MTVTRGDEIILVHRSICLAMTAPLSKESCHSEGKDEDHRGGSWMKAYDGTSKEGSRKKKKANYTAQSNQMVYAHPPALITAPH